MSGAIMLISLATAANVLGMLGYRARIRIIGQHLAMHDRHLNDNDRHLISHDRYLAAHDKKLGFVHKRLGRLE